MASESLTDLMNLQHDGWKQGHGRTVEDLLRDHHLREDAKAIVQLILGEIECRRAAGQACTLQEYLDRFPRQAAELRQLHELDEILARGAKDAGQDWGTFPGYVVLAVAGGGGEGVVFKAHCQLTGRTVAIKVVGRAGQADPIRLASTDREARALGSLLRHDNIPLLHHVGSHGGCRYLVTEYIEGVSLKDRLTGAPLEFRLATALMVTVARTIGYAHNHHIIHADLTPANILIKNDGVTPVVMDFGLSISGLRHPALGGTPGYMAPEVKDGTGEIGPAADIYSLGVILRQLLTGVAPCPGQAPVRPEGVPPELWKIALKALEKDPKDRHGSADEMADRLQRVLDSLQPAPGWWTRAFQFVHVVSAPIALVLLVLVLAAVLFLVRGGVALANDLRARNQAYSIDNKDEKRLKEHKELCEKNDSRPIHLYPDEWSDAQVGRFIGGHVEAFGKRLKPSNGLTAKRVTADLQGLEWIGTMARKGYPKGHGRHARVHSLVAANLGVAYLMAGACEPGDKESEFPHSWYLRRAITLCTEAMGHYPGNSLACNGRACAHLEASERTGDPEAATNAVTDSEQAFLLRSKDTLQETPEDALYDTAVIALMHRATMPTTAPGQREKDIDRLIELIPGYIKVLRSAKTPLVPPELSLPSKLDGLLIQLNTTRILALTDKAVIRR